MVAENCLGLFEAAAATTTELSSLLRERPQHFEKEDAGDALAASLSPSELSNYEKGFAALLDNFGRPYQVQIASKSLSAAPNSFSQAPPGNYRVAACDWAHM